jgi:hypothetical protein
MFIFATSLQSTRRHLRWYHRSKKLDQAFLRWFNLYPNLSYFSLSLSSFLCSRYSLPMKVNGRGWVEPNMTSSKRFGSFPNCYLYGGDVLFDVICSLIGSKFAACLSMSNPRRRIQILRLDLQPIFVEVPPPLVTGPRCSDPRRFFHLFDRKFRLCDQTLSPSSKCVFFKQ